MGDWLPPYTLFYQRHPVVQSPICLILTSVFSVIWKILRYHCPCVDMVVYIMILLNCWSTVFCSVPSVNGYWQDICLSHYLLRSCFLLLREQGSIMESSKEKCGFLMEAKYQCFWQGWKITHVRAEVRLGTFPIWMWIYYVRLGRIHV